MTATLCGINLVCECHWPMSVDSGKWACINLACPHFDKRFAFPKVELEEC